MNLPELLTETEAARAVRVSPAHLAKLARAKQVPYVKVGRSRVYTPDMVTEILATFTSEALTVQSVRARRRGSAA